jgi:hypothetical protein
VIRIRYACLPEGLHATAVTRGRHATIYLRPGLRPGQRRDALARLRRNARLGYAPRLPAAAVACALAADRIRRTLRDLLAAVQCHPLGALGVAGVLAGAAVSYVTLLGAALPAGLPVAAASPPAQVDGDPAVTGQDSGGMAATLAPLGMKPRPWTVPETRPAHRRRAGARQVWQPGPHPPARRGPHRHAGWRWRPRPAGRRLWPGRAGHGWPPRHWRAVPGRPSRHRRDRAPARQPQGSAGGWAHGSGRGW